MPSKLRPVLIAILIILLLGAAIFVSSSLYMDSYNRYSERISSLRTTIYKMETSNVSIDELQSRLEMFDQEYRILKHGYFEPGEITTSSFGISIQELLKRHAITINTYRTITEDDDGILEFSTRGNILSYMDFLKEIHENPREIYIPYLTLSRTQNQNIFTCVFHIGYKTLKEPKTDE